ncbi:MAG: hypothetical protein EOO27_36270 [Comamonadaceae bacterium]|nr:MAG: hypothetical protein EOO27_36270 [Comamonadaceae bacterium]
MAEDINVRLDRVSQAALQVLTADGTSIDVAVRAAIIAAAESLPEPNERVAAPAAGPDDGLHPYGAMMAAAPPLTDYQQYLLTAVFTERRETFMSEEQWEATRASRTREPPA